MKNPTRIRREMVKAQLAARGIRAPAVLRAMDEVPREAFVPDDLVESAYADSPLPIGQGQTISQPYIVDTHNGLPGRKVLVDPFWAERVSWAERRVYVDMTREMVKNSPEFDPSAPVNREYKVRLYGFYGRLEYWLWAEARGGQS